MKKNKILNLILAALILTCTQKGFTEISYDNLAPAQYANRAGLGDKIETGKKEVKAGRKEKKRIEAISSRKPSKNLTYADLSLNQISKDVIDEMDFESPEILADLSILYNNAVQRSETIQYAIYKLSNPDGEKPTDGVIKKILRPIASFSTIAGSAFSSNPYIASGALIGGGLMNAFSGGGDREANYKFTKVDDADMVLLVKKIDELQKNLLNNYMNYRTQKELLRLSTENLENRRKIYNSLQGSKEATREQLIVADTFYRNARNAAQKAQTDYNLSRVILENLAGKGALDEIERQHVN